MWQRKINKKEKQRAAGGLKDRLAGKIAGEIIRVQARIAAALGKWERRCTLKQRKICLAVLGACFALYYSYLLGSTLLSDTIDIPARKVLPVAQPPPPTFLKDSAAPEK